MQSAAVTNPASLHFSLFHFQCRYGLPTARNRRLRREVAVLRGCVGDIVRARVAAVGRGEVQHEDLLKYLLAAADEEAAGSVSSETLVDNLITLMFGGFDTTSIGDASCLFCIFRRVSAFRSFASVF